VQYEDYKFEELFHLLLSLKLDRKLSVKSSNRSFASTSTAKFLHIRSSPFDPKNSCAKHREIISVVFTETVITKKTVFVQQILKKIINHTFVGSHPSLSRRNFLELYKI
jgi:hypothetical protein